jgi:hypothetical protein
VGIITLSDVLRYVIGHVDIPEVKGSKDDADEEQQKAKPPTPEKTERSP